METPRRTQNGAYVEIATRAFREGLARLVADYARQGVDVRDVLGDPAEFATTALHAAARLVHDRG